MPRPGIAVSLRETPGAVVTVPTDTSTWFAVGLTERGPTTPLEVLSLDNFKTKFGNRVTYSVLYDCIEAFFREGGSKVYVARVVGPGATQGFLNLLDSAAAISLVATAYGPGDWSANFKVQVLAGSVAGTFVIKVLDSVNVVLEDSGNLEDQNAAILWSQRSNYIRLTLGASALDPAVVAATALSAGNDQRAAITDTQWDTATDAFLMDLGPGQISQPGRTTTTAHTQLNDHAKANNRVAILDLTDSSAVATLIANVEKGRFTASFAPWVTIPGITASTTRSIPPSPVIAGMIARNDAPLGANHPAAGRFGISNLAIDLSQVSWTDVDRESLNAGGVNVIRKLYGRIVNYGWRSGVDPVVDVNWLSFGNGRLYMKLVAELNQVGENYIFEEIDGQNGRTIGGFHDALAGVLVRHWQQGELFGDTADEAFDVDTGPSVNTLVTIQNLELRAICYVKMSPFAEYVVIEVVRRSLTEGV